MLPVLGIELVEALAVRGFDLREPGAALEPEDLPVVVALDVVMELDELLLERIGDGVTRCRPGTGWRLRADLSLFELDSAGLMERDQGADRVFLVERRRLHDLSHRVLAVDEV